MPIPGSGIFRIYPTFINIVSGEFDIQAGSTPVAEQPLATREQVQAYYESEVSDVNTCPKLRRSTLNTPGTHYTPAAGTYEIQAFLKHTVIFDVAGVPTPIDFISADFPMGCRFNQLSVVSDGVSSAGAWASNRRVDSFSLKARQSIVFNEVFPSDPFGASPTSEIVPFFQHWGINQVFGVTLGQIFVISNTPGGPGVSLFVANTNWYLQGSYNFSWISLTLDPENANPGDTITITDTNENMGLFGDFKAYWKCDPDSEDYCGGVLIPRSYWSKTDSQVILKLPLDSGLPFGGRRIVIFGVVDDPLWPGDNEVPLAQVNETPLLTDGSGMYNLQFGKRNDTYYDRSTSPVGRINRKIPNPLARTGFF